jgi:hypothetical protein
MTCIGQLTTEISIVVLLLGYVRGLSSAFFGLMRIIYLRS